MAKEGGTSEMVVSTNVEDTTQDSTSKRAKRDDYEHYDDIKRENTSFTDYYKKNEIVPEEEWTMLVDALGRSLPITFRLTGHREEAASIGKQLNEILLPKLGTAAHVLEWYRPNGFAFHLDTDRRTLRTDVGMKEFHNWLVSATENGDISRQEAVSMVPPLFLDVQSDHLVLDMCAAPGSKTAQLVEYMHADAQKSKREPTGLVIANDADQQRAYMLYHQVKRILSPCLLVTNNDGTMFPFLYSRNGEAVERVLFDRILADVPCSGDGTLRKNAQLWKTWNASHGLGLHPLQVRLLEKAVRLLKVGGRIVYSTCSMNFIENEAVVAHVVEKYRHALEFVNVSDELSELIRRPGHASWKVITKDGEEYKSVDEVPANLKKRFPSSLFPKSSYADLGIEHCLRIYPHLQNTGAFFVAVISKRAEINQPIAERSNEEGMPAAKPAPPRKGTTRFHVASKAQDEFRNLDVSNEKVLENIFEWYGIDKQRMIEEGFGFLVRSEREPIRVISIVSPTAQPIFAATCPPHRASEEAPIIYNQGLKIVNAGVRAFESYESSRPVPVNCVYRPLAESVAVLRPFMTKRVALIPQEEMMQLLESQDSVKLPIGETFGQGGAIFETKTAEGNLVSIPVWLSERGVKAFVPAANRPAMILQLQKSS
jgi:16S rRNA C967 or C1407 C5-methylase (RsmB/RsmF family)